jgi:hypothetical protein
MMEEKHAGGESVTPKATQRHRPSAEHFLCFPLRGVAWQSDILYGASVASKEDGLAGVRIRVCAARRANPSRSGCPQSPRASYVCEVAGLPNRAAGQQRAPPQQREGEGADAAQYYRDLSCYFSEVPRNPPPSWLLHGMSNSPQDEEVRRIGLAVHLSQQ